jgi:hypothetical protein
VRTPSTKIKAEDFDQSAGDWDAVISTGHAKRVAGAAKAAAGLGSLVLTKVERRLIWSWRFDTDYHDSIECAVRSDLTSPADEFLDQLEEGAWVADPEHVPPADDEQIHDYYSLIANIEFLGVEGRPRNRGCVNFLVDGIWEFKQYTRRLTYWDTPGDGTFTPKDKIDDRRTISGPETPDYWWYPHMDAQIRLGCAWPKTGQSAPQEGIDEARLIRSEDCAHDL